MDALRIRTGGSRWFRLGCPIGDAVAALWPERVVGLVAVSGYLIGSVEETGRPYHRLPSAPGGISSISRPSAAGWVTPNTCANQSAHGTASPAWAFDNSTFARSAASFDNPDHVDIVIHNYRWRIGAADGEEQYAAVEARLAGAPAIAVPAITMEGDANGAPHPDPAAYRSKFVGPYQHRLITGGVGHNLPQEAPGAFAQAVITLASRRS